MGGPAEPDTPREGRWPGPSVVLGQGHHSCRAAGPAGPAGGHGGWAGGSPRHSRVPVQDQPPRPAPQRGGRGGRGLHISSVLFPALGGLVFPPPPVLLTLPHPLGEGAQSRAQRAGQRARVCAAPIPAAPQQGPRALRARGDTHTPGGGEGPTESPVQRPGTTGSQHASRHQSRGAGPRLRPQAPRGLAGPVPEPRPVPWGVRGQRREARGTRPGTHAHNRGRCWRLFQRLVLLHLNPTRPLQEVPRSGCFLRQCCLPPTPATQPVP